MKEKQLKELQGVTTNVYLPFPYLLALMVGRPSSLVALWVLLVQTRRLPSSLAVADCLLLLSGQI